MLQPTVRRTWAPQGQPPIHLSWDRHDRLSVIAAISLSSKRKHLGLYFDITDRHIHADEFDAFVCAIRRQLRRSIILVMDRYSVHSAGVKRLSAHFGKRIQTEWLPSYSPDLNPVEQIWKRTKYDDLPNFISDDVYQLGQEVSGSIRNTRSSKAILRSFFEHCELTL